MFRLKTQPGDSNDMMSVGANGLLASVKAQSVADETGLVVVLERDTHFPELRGEQRHQWVPDMVFFPSLTGTPSKALQPSWRGGG
jgi:hypothetical protein